MNHKAKLGDLVKDRVSGFKGIAVALHRYLNGCDRISVQPMVEKDGKLPESKTFDAPDLKVVQRGAVKYTEPVDLPPGGPEKFMPEGKPE
ncbi:MAG: hypothetical protein HYW70_03595 [Candidatus Nealsonbacteria bacterium]|nr:hypothetical protein [Candidatus Nealsonbacteria bacterium]